MSKPIQGSRTRRMRRIRLGSRAVRSPLKTRLNTVWRLVIGLNSEFAVTYDHRLRRTGHPVRSAIHKPQIGRLVVGWVTTSEYLLLYVLFFLPFFCRLCLLVVVRVVVARICIMVFGSDCKAVSTIYCPRKGLRDYPKTGA
jgi:hypothetical protein